MVLNLTTNGLNNFNKITIMSIFSSFPMAHINVYFFLDGKKYEVEHFNTSFSQEYDYKGQPQNEVHGGQLVITVTNSADDNLYLWAKKSTLLKSGEILFQTDLGITVLRLNFTNAYCVNLTREISAYSGTKTTLIIAPESINANGVTHDNKWTYKD